MGAPNWLSDVSLVVSPVVSLAGAAMSFVIYRKQKLERAATSHALQSALTPSLIGDINTALAGIDSVIDQAEGFRVVRMVNAKQAGEILRALANVRLPTFAEYKDNLPAFDVSVARALLRAYSTLERTRSVVSGFLSGERSLADWTVAIQAVRKEAPHARDHLIAARNALEELL